MPPKRHDDEPSCSEAGEGSAPGPSPARQDALIEALRSITFAIARPAEQERLFRTVAEEASALFGAASATTCILDESDLLQVRVGTGLLASLEGDILPVEGSFAGRAVLTRQAQQTPDLSADPRAYLPWQREFAVGPGLALPLVSSGRALGALLIVREPDATPFTPGEVHSGRVLADSVAAVIESARNFVRARRSRVVMEQWRSQIESKNEFSRCELALQASGTVVFEWDASSDTLRWGTGLGRALGYDAGEFGSNLSDWAERIHPEDRTRVVDQMETAMRRSEDARLEMRLCHKHGYYRRFLMRAQSSTADESLTLLGTLQELATRESEERSGATAEKELIRALRHEINNPLAVIVGQVQLLGREPAVEDSPILKESIRAIHDESRRIDDLLKHLAYLEHSSEGHSIVQEGRISFPSRYKE